MLSGTRGQKRLQKKVVCAFRSVQPQCHSSAYTHNYNVPPLGSLVRLCNHQRELYLRMKLMAVMYVNFSQRFTYQPPTVGLAVANSEALWCR